MVPIRRIAKAPLVVGLAAAVALAGEPPKLPAALTLSAGAVHLELEWKTAFSSREHRLRSLVDEASLEARLDLACGPARGAWTPVEATPRSLALRRHKRGKTAGFFSDDELEARGAAAWKAGQPGAPPSWRLLVSSHGAAVADAAPVTSEGARWPLARWLDLADARSDEEARLRRLFHGTNLGTLLGAPELPSPGAQGARFEARFPLVAGESGLTNALVELGLVYDLAVEASPRGEGFVRVRGPLARVALVKGQGRGDGGPDRWLDVAFLRGGPEARGELEATFDRSRGRWVEGSSSVSLSHVGHFDGGSGRASFERRLRFKVE